MIEADRVNHTEANDVTVCTETTYTLTMPYCVTLECDRITVDQNGLLTGDLELVWSIDNHDEQRKRLLKEGEERWQPNDIGIRKKIEQKSLYIIHGLWSSQI